MMGEEPPWNYALLPPRNWVWELAERHWITARISPNGLSYIGSDWSIQSGGDYFAGFQSFDEFLREGPLPQQQMPEVTAAEVRQHLLTHRTSGGAGLRLLHLNQTASLVPWRFFIELDEQPIQLTTALSPEAREVVLFEGALPPGSHHLSFVLMFRLPQKRQGGRQWRTQGEQRFVAPPGLRTTLTLVTRQDETTLSTGVTLSG